MRTNTRVSFGLYDVTAKGDSTPQSSTAEWFVNLADLKAKAVPTLPKYGTLEENQFLLDGQFEHFPDAPQGKFWGYWSSALSDANGEFATPQNLSISFTQPHSSIGLTLHFYAPTKDWATQVHIKWLGPAGETIDEGMFYPDSALYYAEKKVENYYKITMDFYKTSLPYRRVKLNAIAYGMMMELGGDDIVDAKILEEIDMLSNEVRVNTLQLKLFSRDAMFSILNPRGIFSILQHKQRLDVIEIVDDAEINMGSFYLSDWSNDSDTMASFKAVDAVGYLDSAPHMGGVYNTTAGSMAAEILQGYEYDMHPQLAGIRVAGYLPVGTRRTALQQLAFAIGAVVDCSRSAVIQIYPPPERPSSYISYSRKFQGGKVKMRPLITGIQVSAHVYTPSEEIKELFKQTLAPGAHRVLYSNPAHSPTITGATIVQSGVNYADIQVAAQGEVIIKGKLYTDATTIISQQADNVPANAEDNLLTVEDATLVSPALAPGVAERTLNYYAKRYTQDFSMLAGTEKLADMVILETFGKEKLRGMFESMNIDLTGGFRVDATVVGARIDDTRYQYTGEFYTGEWGMI